MSRHLIRFALVISVLGFASAAFGQNSGLIVTAKAKNEAPRFYGFSFDFTANDSSGLNSVGQGYRNDLSFYFEPTWSIGKMYARNSRWKGLSLAARFIVTQNLSGVDDSNFSGVSNSGPVTPCSNILPQDQGGLVDPTTVKYCNPIGNDRRTDYSDLWLTLRAPKIVTIPKLELPINPSIRFVLPTSMQSRYSNLAMSISAWLGTGRAFWKDRIRLGYSLGFNKNFHTDLTPTRGGTSTAQGSIVQDGNQYQGSGSANFFLDPTRVGATNINTSYSVTQVISGGIQFHEKVSLDVLYILGHGFRYSLPCTLDVNGTPEDVCANGDAVAGSSGSRLSRPGESHSQTLWISLNYNPLDWLTLSAAWINGAPLTYPDGSYRQGIISTNYDAFTSVSLGATISIDGVANKLWPSKSQPTKQAGLARPIVVNGKSL